MTSLSQLKYKTWNYALEGNIEEILQNTGIGKTVLD
jgi:hypothetical protein